MNRGLDVAIAGAGLVLTSPLLGAAALAIKLEDGGPVLYRQTRVGKDGAVWQRGGTSDEAGTGGTVVKTAVAGEARGVRKKTQANGESR